MTRLAMFSRRARLSVLLQSSLRNSFGGGSTTLHHPSITTSSSSSTSSSTPVTTESTVSMSLSSALADAAILVCTPSDDTLSSCVSQTHHIIKDETISKPKPTSTRVGVKTETSGSSTEGKTSIPEKNGTISVTTGQAGVEGTEKEGKMTRETNGGVGGRTKTRTRRRTDDIDEDAASEATTLPVVSGNNRMKSEKNDVSTTSLDGENVTEMATERSEDKNTEVDDTTVKR
eukprot:CAMPEP_0182433564 /NCGR_PEP_ID=MMETSP1167-20130531/64045_1 /TAXON_ID=2988 /ORGANISM="Mallomonas Sp, Strain CCMP3275" /LENGTH=230 /DNA_ID=CAMNT_0024622403 /DNA_START=169 /DNA_END=858 /DNA_ORIENTATION=+